MITIAECCFNCKHRKSRKGNSVGCDFYGKHAGRLKCQHYGRTENKHILKQEAKMFPEEPQRKTFFDNWLGVNLKKS